MFALFTRVGVAVLLLLPVWAANAARAEALAAFDPFVPLHRFEEGVEQLQRQQPARVAAADALAAAILGGADFAVGGCPALRLDMTHRPGAMLGYGGAAAEPGDAALYLLPSNETSEADIGRHVERIAALSRGGSTVVALVPRERLASLGLLRLLKRHTAAVLDVQVGLADGEELRRAAAVTAAWALHVEMFAACVERGEVPVERMHAELDRRSDRLLRYVGQRFHDDRWLDPPPTGELSSRFLHRVKRLSLDLRTASGNALEAAAWRCRDTTRLGGSVHVAGGPRTPFLREHLQHAGGVMSPWNGSDHRAALGPEDVLVAFCHRDPPGVTHWRDLDAMRRAGLGVVWIMPAFGIASGDLPGGDLLLDNQVPFADASIDLDRYDADLGPLSSIANELLLATLSHAAESMAKSGTLRATR